MGQYYTPVVLDEDGKITHHLRCYDWDSGAKLLEHSWLGNKFVAAVETLLVQEAPVRVVWAGDYADAEIDPETGGPLIIKSDLYTAGEGEANLYTLAGESGLDLYRPETPGLGMEIVWQPREKAKKDAQGNTIFKRRRNPEIVANAHPQIKVSTTSHPFLLNWDKREYVDKRKTPKGRFGKLHPLPLLTVEGNGRGGGDFDIPQPPSGDDNLDQFRARRSEGNTGNFKLIGSWARDHISASPKRPQGNGWTQIAFDLKEGNPA